MEWFNIISRCLKMDINPDLNDPINRFINTIHLDWVDHGILRRFWKNEHEIAPNVYRANHPTVSDLERYKEMGIKTILSLRGDIEKPAIWFEKDACNRLGLKLLFVPFGSREAPQKETLLKLIDTFNTIKHPFVMHCKSGADRTSLASAIYLLTQNNANMPQAYKMMSIRFIHLKFTKTGVLDHILNSYDRCQSAKAIDFETWVADEYDQHKIQHEFDNTK